MKTTLLLKIACVGASAALLFSSCNQQPNINCKPDCKPKPKDCRAKPPPPSNTMPPQKCGPSANQRCMPDRNTPCGNKRSTPCSSYGRPSQGSSDQCRPMNDCRNRPTTNCPPSSGCQSQSSSKAGYR